MNTERRFHIEQDRDYSGEWINEKQKWSNTKVKMLSTYTVYESVNRFVEFVGNPSYQTPVFQGSKSQCKKWVNEILRNHS